MQLGAGRLRVRRDAARASFHQLGIVQHLEHQASLRRAYQHDGTLIAQHHPAQGPAPALHHGGVEHPVGRLGGRPIGYQVQAPAGEEHRIQLPGIDEAFQA
jgi:hypothetical protein